MTFHPDVLDLAQVKRLAKNMRKGSGSVLANEPLTLTQSQELLARTLGYQNWHDLQTRKIISGTQEGAIQIKPDPLKSVIVRIQIFSQLNSLIQADVNCIHAMTLLVETLRHHGQEDVADALEQDWLPGMMNGSEDWTVFFAEKLRSYNPYAATWFDLLARANKPQLVSHSAVRDVGSIPTARAGF